MYQIILNSTRTMENHKLINNNTVDPKLNSSSSSSPCCRLATGKQTFLKSNQLITKYVKQGNVKENSSTIHSNTTKSEDAYEMCKNQLELYEEKQRDKEDKLQRVLVQAKTNSYQLEVQKLKKEEQIDRQVKKLELMVETLYVKSADIMHGRNSSNYTRKAYDFEEVPLKDLKSTTCERSLKKVEDTRKVMINKSHKLVEQLPYSSQKSINVSGLTDSFSGNSTMNSSSFLTHSLISNENKIRTKKQKNQSIYKKLLHVGSFDQISSAKRRNAVNEGFAMCWKLGTQDKKLKKISLFQNLQKITQRRKKQQKKEQKVSYFQHLSENEKFELELNKKYSAAFENVVKKFAFEEKI